MSALNLLNNYLILSVAYDGAAMSKSNPSAANGIVYGDSGLDSYTLPEGFPLPERAEDPLADAYIENTERYFRSMEEERSDCTTPKAHSCSQSASNRWSDATPTESLSRSGRYSRYSWESVESADEEEFDRAVTESVRRKFDKINAALYQDKTTGATETDKECKEWSLNFPHFEVHGHHLLDTLDDGTEIAEADPFAFVSDSLADDVNPMWYTNELAVVGQKVVPKPLQGGTSVDHLREEVFAADGVVEEYFAYDHIVDETESHRRSKLKRSTGLPPVTPNACVKDTVKSLLFDQIWSEVITILHPLLVRIKQNASQGHGSGFSLGGGSLSSVNSPLGIGPLQHEPYLLRGLRDQPTLTRAPGQSGSQFLRFKHSQPNLPSTLPQLTNLTGVMQIRSVSLQQRVPSTMMPLNDTSREGTPTPFGRPESCMVGSRLLKNTTPLPPRPSDYQLPATPGNRLLSSRMTNRRNVTLKPIDRPKTPALVPIDDGIRGFKLQTNPSHSSPPSTPFVRKDQLPPLDSASSSVHVVGAGVAVSISERSPPTQLRTSAQKNRVTFNSRIVSAVDSGRYSRASSDQRPSSTTTAFRHGPDGTPRLQMRKGSDHLLNYRMKMSSTTTRGKHGAVGSSGGAGLQLSELGFRDRVTSCIAEDDEAIDDEATSFAVTGTSEFFRKETKPRTVLSGRTKSKGHVR